MTGARPGSEVAELATGSERFPRRLRPGPGQSPALVSAHQRMRLHAAMVALVDELGWDRVRVRAVARTAKVSTATFYIHFANAEDCFASAFDAVMAEALGSSAAAQGDHSDWRGSLFAAIGALMKEFSDQPRAARVALLGLLGVARKRGAGSAVRWRISNGSSPTLSGQPQVRPRPRDISSPG